MEAVQDRGSPEEAQRRGAGEIVLIDPLVCDLSPLVALFQSDSLAVLHAAQQDLDVLAHAVKAVPKRLYDTQLAAGFLGYSTPSLVSLLQSELKVTAAKGDRLTDWLRRPLTADQCEYAAADVAHLLQLHDRLTKQLAELGRTSWADDACDDLLRKPVSVALADYYRLRIQISLAALVLVDHWLRQRAQNAPLGF